MSNQVLEEVLNNAEARGTEAIQDFALANASEAFAPWADEATDIA